jgi:hypothetical protein
LEPLERLELKRSAVQENFICAIEANARRFSNKPVLLSENAELTWSELDRWASGFCLYLSPQGVGV